jgi:hypothetical protein
MFVLVKILNWIIATSATYIRKKIKIGSGIERPSKAFLILWLKQIIKMIIPIVTSMAPVKILPLINANTPAINKNHTIGAATINVISRDHGILRLKFMVNPPLGIG